MKKLVIFAALAVALSACHNNDNEPVPPTPVYENVERIEMRLDNRLEPYRALLQHNFDRMIPIINSVPGPKGPYIRVLVQYGFVYPGPKAGTCVFSFRNPHGGDITMRLFGDNPEGQCRTGGKINRAHWSGGFGWELAHLIDCGKTGNCGDGAYVWEEAARLDRELYNLPWDGEDLYQ